LSVAAFLRRAGGSVLLSTVTQCYYPLFISENRKVLKLTRVSRHPQSGRVGFQLYTHPGLPTPDQNVDCGPS